MYLFISWTYIKIKEKLNKAGKEKSKRFQLRPEKKVELRRASEVYILRGFQQSKKYYYFVTF